MSLGFNLNLQVTRFQKGEIVQTSVLVVESDPSSQDQLCSIVRDCEFQVFPATDLNSALEQIKDHRFQIMIIDWQLPRGEAQSIVKCVRANHRLRRTHIIALSDQAEPEVIQKVLKSGADDFFARPVTTTEVRSRLLWATNRLNAIS
jgi:DNA-binding response OmpR family regulator